VVLQSELAELDQVVAIPALVIPQDQEVAQAYQMVAVVHSLDLVVLDQLATVEDLQDQVAPQAEVPQEVVEEYLLDQARLLPPPLSNKSLSQAPKLN